MSTAVRTVTRVDEVAPGSKAWLRQRFTSARGRSFEVSVGVLRGSRPGRCLANVAGQHGMEHTGPLLLRDLFDELDPRQIAGTLLLCPCANPVALELDFEVYPETLDAPAGKPLTYEALGVQRREQLGQDNMNRLWRDDIAAPAVPGESVAQQVTRWLWRTMIAPADVVIDHHSVKRALKPYVFAEEPAVPFAPLLGLECIWCTGPLPPPPTPYPWQRLGLQSIRHGKVGLVVEYTLQHLVHEPDIALGKFAVLNTMRALGMIEGQVTIPRPVWALPGPYWEGMVELSAQALGHLRFLVDEYQPLRGGQTIAHVRDLQTQQVLQEIEAPSDGLMLHRANEPVARPGEFICRFHPHARLLAEPGKPYVMPPLPKPGV